MIVETHSRSLLKAVSWRALGTITTVLLVYAFTQKAGVSILVGALEASAKLLLYFFHERLWNKLSFGRRTVIPAVVWFTGYSGSGKSTVANAVFEELKKRKCTVERLDGDTVRDILPQTGFSREERNMHVKRVGLLASRLEANGVFVVASFISPYREGRDFVRGLCRNFIEIHVSTPLEECEKRDVKGLYNKARQGLIKNFTGIDDPYEIPLSPRLAIDTSKVSIEDAVKRVLSVLSESAN